jgi:hypothetical protein
MKELISLKSLLLTLIFLILGVQVISASEASIQVNLKVGTDYKFSTTRNLVSLETINGMEHEVKRKQIFEYTLSPSNKDSNGNYYVNLKFTRIALETIANEVNYSYDSKINSPQDLTLPWMKSNAALVNSNFQLILSSNGKILDIKDTDKSMDKVSNLIYGNNAEVDQQIRESLLNIFSIASLKDLLESSFVKSPEFVVEPRATWTDKKSVTDLITLDIAFGYLVKALSNNEISMDLMSTLAAYEVDKKVVNGSEVSYKLLGSTVGSLTVNRNLGLVSNFESTQKISGSITSYFDCVKKEMPFDVEIVTTTDLIK